MEKINYEEIRYKVIADYPHSPWLFGEILFVKKGELVGQETGYVDYMYQIMERDVLDFPHLFKKLEWWKDRKSEEMPAYFRYTGNIESLKVIAPLKIPIENVIAVVKSMYGQDITHQILPATEEEYKAFLAASK